MWWKSILSWIISVWASDVMTKLKACIPIITVKVEEAMQDGKITPAERKDLAMSLLDTVAGQFNVKISPLVRWAISHMIDKMAGTLPSQVDKVNISSLTTVTSK